MRRNNVEVDSFFFTCLLVIDHTESVWWKIADSLYGSLVSRLASLTASQQLRCSSSAPLTSRRINKRYTAVSSVQIPSISNNFQRKKKRCTQHWHVCVSQWKSQRKQNTWQQNTNKLHQLLLDLYQISFIYLLRVLSYFSVGINCLPLTSWLTGNNVISEGWNVITQQTCCSSSDTIYGNYESLIFCKEYLEGLYYGPGIDC